jgi:hypothetical protein
MVPGEESSAGSSGTSPDRVRTSSKQRSWRKFNGEWWYSDPAVPTRWKRLQGDTYELPVHPPDLTWFQRATQSIDSTSPLPPLLIGVTAALIALVLAITIVPGNSAAVLAPVLTAIGAFAGHAAGHAAAKQK